MREDIKKEFVECRNQLAYYQELGMFASYSKDTHYGHNVAVRDFAAYILYLRGNGMDICKEDE